MTTTEEIEQTEREETLKEPMYQWIDAHITGLEDNFLNSLPPEEMLLDDDIPDYLNDSDEFHEFCEQSYYDEVE